MEEVVPKVVKIKKNKVSNSHRISSIKILLNNKKNLIKVDLKAPKIKKNPSSKTKSYIKLIFMSSLKNCFKYAPSKISIKNLTKRKLINNNPTTPINNL